MLEVERHKTAIRRSALSKPVQSLVDLGLVRKEVPFFDFGCGFGDDVRILTENGYDASGWDPVYFSKQSKRSAEVVNLGYVLNVIDDPEERISVIQEAYNLSTGILCVAVLYDTSANRPKGTSWRDGILTNRNTFQKLFDQSELISLLEASTSEPAVAIAPGIALVFKDAKARIRFEISRSHRRYVPIAMGPSTEGRHGPILEQLVTEYPNDWQYYRRFLLENGRPPEIFESHFVERCKMRRIAPNTLFALAIEDIGQETFERARDRNRDDLLIFFATAHFGKKPRLSDLPKKYQFDIKYHFGSMKRGFNSGLAILSESADIALRQERALECQVGTQKDNGLFVQPESVGDLDVYLRGYIALGTLFFGDFKEAQMIKIHLSSNKITYFLSEEDSGMNAFKVDFQTRSMTTYSLPHDKVRQLQESIV